MSDALPTWDPESGFSALAAFGGDVSRAAVALRVPEAELVAVAERYGWLRKLAHLGLIPAGAKQASPEVVSAVQRKLNRTANLVQALKARDLCDRLLNELLTDPDKLRDATNTPTKFGDKREFKAVRDLIEAANSAQTMTRLALQDDDDHAEADAKILKESGQALATDMVRALDAAVACSTTSTALVRESMAAAEGTPSVDPDAGRSPRVVSRVQRRPDATDPT